MTFTVRPAATDEWPQIKALRDAGLTGRPLVQNVPVPRDVTWWVADRGTGVHSCVGAAFVYYGHYEDEFDIVITDIYRDNTREGKLGLACILRQAVAFPQRVTTTVPLDRVGLMEQLLKEQYGGFAATGIEFTKPRSVAKEHIAL